jgi:polyribonucleotide nucleotidyltransferase
MQYSVQREIGGKNLVIETGKYAGQANGAVTVRLGDSIILATVCISPQARPDIDFLPLTVDYEERLYATGKIPGSFFRREGRPGQEAILFGRLTDRPLRPLFPKGLHNEIQIIITVLSVDRENPPETLGTIGASAALSISDIPLEGPVSSARVSHANGVYTVNPTYSEIAQGDLNVVVAGTKGAVMMVEAGATDVSEELMLEAIRRAQEANGEVIAMIEEMVAAVGKPKMSIAADAPRDDLDGEISTILNGRLSQVLEAGRGKTERDQSLGELEAEVQERLGEQYSKGQVAAAFESIVKKQMRSRILDEGIRPDGRGLTDIRPISCEVGILPRTHGSGIFTRGQTQVLTVATLASTGMKQILDNLSPEETKRFMHHYNFLPFSTGEVKRIATGRREVGHGALAERAIEVAVPSEDVFPYTIRLVSEVLSSNGSTSMASVCGSTLALMDAGVPMKSPVAGVAMGLIMGENGRSAILTDIEGMEDHLGDMDFKVAGTARGINALQMDIKVKGLTYEVLERALEQAREGRLFILAKMEEAIAQPREHLSTYAPKMARMTVPVSKIGVVIGPGGRTIRAMQEETGVTIDVADDGTINIGSNDEAMIQKTKARIEGLTRELVVGDIFTGKVMRLTNFGAFVELLPGKEGLLRTGELGDTENGLKVGQEITVMVQEIDSMGRINLSQRALSGGQDGPRDATSRPPRPPQAGPRQGGPPFGSRGGRPGQGGDRSPSPGQGGSRPGPGPNRRPPPRPTLRG